MLSFCRLLNWSPGSLGSLVTRRWRKADSNCWSHFDGDALRNSFFCELHTVRRQVRSAPRKTDGSNPLLSRGESAANSLPQELLNHGCDLKGRPSLLRVAQVLSSDSMLPATGYSPLVDAPGRAEEASVIERALDRDHLQQRAHSVAGIVHLDLVMRRTGCIGEVCIGVRSSCVRRGSQDHWQELKRKLPIAVLQLEEAVTG
jgi:hypothetical protein